MRSLAAPVFLILIATGNLFAQEKKDTTQLEKVIENIRDSRVTKQITESITQTPSDENAKPQKSEELFMPYEGKIIRKIIVNPITFEKNVTDTTHHITNTIAKVGNVLHNNSKTWMLRDLLFFYENKPLDPYRLADNERYLRDLDFIKDARIYIHPLMDTNDSVDIEVVTRDVFSVGGSFNPSGATTTKFKVYDSNLAGWGQRLEFAGFVDTDRTPVFGYDFLYRKNSLGGSLISATIGYTQLNNSSSYGEENEIAYYLKLDRPLVSPYTRFAGGLEISRNWSKNVYNRIDSLFIKYRYDIQDLWIGYNIPGLSEGRNRYFVGIRGFNQHYDRHPVQPDKLIDPLYNNRQYLLAKFTFFRQDFYKSRFIYGFGRTEDLPYGHTVSVLFGLEKQFGLQRPYIGAEGEKTFVHRKGHFYTLGFRTGSFRANSRFEDATFLGYAEFFSKIIPYKKLLIRQSLNLNFTKVINQKISLPLDINGEFGLQNFFADSLHGNKRLNAGTETMFFTPWKLLGFKFALFGYGEVAWLAQYTQDLWDRTPFYGIGGGVRTRNENLVFGTIEARFVYYPRVVEDIPQFKVSLSSNLRVKYTGNFVRAPSFVIYN